MKRRVGIYSGSFDPIHQGHVAFALEAMRTCHLDQVVFLPEPTPRNKPTVTDIVHRVALIEQVISDQTNLSVIRPPQAQFNVRETLPKLQSSFDGDFLTLLVGSDVVRTLSDRWEDLDILLGSVSLAIGMRDGDTPEEIIAILDQLKKQHAIQIQYDLVETHVSDVASSQVRYGEKSATKLHPAIKDYVKKHNLYT